MKLTLLFFVLALVACSSPSGDRNNAALTEQRQASIPNKTLNGNDSTACEFDSDCVVFLMPGDSMIEKMQKEYSEEDYNEIVADITWYPGIASEYLDSLGIKVKMIDNQRFLVFKSANGKLLKLRKSQVAGDMILFRTDTLPIISHAVDFNRDLTRNFFRK